MAEEPWRHEVVDALRSGMKLEAIKLYRERTGVGLAEAKAFVDALDQSLITGELPAATEELALDLEAKLIDYLRSGNFIGAIKHYRDATGSDLYDSKQAMEALARRKGIPIASPVPIALWMLAAAVILGGIIAAVFLV